MSEVPFLPIKRDLRLLYLDRICGLEVYISSIDEFDHIWSLQIFPIHMKGSAGSLVTLVNWLSSWIVSYAFNFLLVWSPYGKHGCNTENGPCRASVPYAHLDPLKRC
jgi:hypothetical protein